MTNVRKITAQQFKMLANGRRKVMGDGNVVHCPKSIALEGAPGMGKTAVIRSLGEDWGLPVVTVAINQWCNAADIVGAGAQILVAGSSVFKAEDPAAAIAAMRI